LGQSWSTPNIAKIAYGSGDKRVAFIGGGYDEGQDNDVPPADDKGRAIYVIDVLDGSLIRRFSVDDSGYSTMTYSIPSDIARVDLDGNGKVDRLYMGDMGGRMWRFDISDSNPANWSGKIIFQSNPGNDGSTGRKIFYPPDVTLEKDSINYEMLFFGTGDREDPNDTDIVNRIYAVKDKNPITPLLESYLIDVTLGLLQDPNASQSEKDALLEQLRTGNGWYIKFDADEGEKVLAPPVLLFRAAYFTTFTPTFGVEGDPCFVGEGIARLYILQYQTGNAIYNFDLTNDTEEEDIISATDRSREIGTAIPSGVIVTFIQGKPTAYIGVGGGVMRGIPQEIWDENSNEFPLTIYKSIIPIYWRTVF
jgi:type IV pilus assembly protein PilY1